MTTAGALAAAHTAWLTVVNKHITVTAGQLTTTTAFTVANTTKQTQVTLTVGDARITQGAAGRVLTGQTAGQQAQQIATAGQVQSSLPAGWAQTVAQQQAAQRTQALMAQLQALQASLNAPVVPRQTVLVTGALPSSAPLASLPPLPGEGGGGGTSATTPVNSQPARPAPAPTVISGQTAGAQTVVAGQLVSASSPHPRPPPGGEGASQAATGAGTTFTVSASPTAAPATLTVGAGSGRITSAPLSPQAQAAQAQIAAQTAARAQPGTATPIAFTPTGPTTAAQAQQEVTANMIASAGSCLFGSTGVGGGLNGALMGLALGAGAVQYAGATPAGAGNRQQLAQRIHRHARQQPLRFRHVPHPHLCTKQPTRPGKSCSISY